MELSEKKIELQKERLRLLNRLEALDKTIFKYDNLSEVKTPFLIKELSQISELKSGKVKGFSINVYNGNYQYILGGDGRSQPWDETRKGVICDVETSYYLTDVQRKLIGEYLKSLGKIDKLNIK